MTTQNSRPHIVFINTDQQSARMLSCTGNPWVHTPNMDRIAKEGMRFDRAYCTNPVCLPSRFSWFTGRMPSELGIRDNKNPDLKTVPSHVLESCMGPTLSRAGYTVAYGGKTHLPGDMEPETMGCEFITENKRDDLATVSAQWIKDHAADETPFCLSTCFVNPHDICFMSMREYLICERADDPDLNFNERWLLRDDSVEMGALAAAMALPDGVSEDEFYESYCPPLPPNHHIQDNEPCIIADGIANTGYRNFAREQWTERQWRLHRWAYARLTEQVDKQIGVILDAIDDAGIAGNTVVIFTSDHGDHDGSHKLDQKGLFYEESTNIPLLVRWPAMIAAGQVDTTHVVSNGLDILPTMCDIAGCKIPDGLLGNSLVPLFSDERTESFTRQAIPMECTEGNAIVMGSYKYLRYNSGEHAEQLMDLEADPHETRNHVSDPGPSEALADCKRAYARYFS